ncbi:MAG: hypothetical protein SGI71_01070 [Verrucomicrobiota bacterium]|nr:hypothetical protein [Verrucomicrobiota bacterium]
MKEITFNGWNAVELSNEHLQLIVTKSVGPRLISLKGKEGREFMFHHPDQKGVKGGEKWNIFGGHRLWHSPEVEPRTYAPDNDPVEIIPLNGGIVARQAVEKSTGLRKEIEIIVHPTQPVIELVHRTYNDNPWDVEFSNWCLTVLAAGGKAYVPFEGRIRTNKYLNDRVMTVWPYTDLSDKRGFFAKDFVTIKQETQCNGPYKLGFSANAGWAAYALGNEVLIKNVSPQTLGAEVYPDDNSGLEIYTCDMFLELETLSPLKKVAPGFALVHKETWTVLPLSSSDPRVKAVNAAL